MGEKRVRLTSFADLGKHFGVQTPPSQVDRTDTENFYSLPLLQRLRECDDVRGRAAVGHDRRERKVATIGDVLRMDKDERAKLGIRAFAVGALDGDGGIVAEEESLQSAHIHVLYPSNFEARPRMLDCPDDLLSEQEGISLDAIVGLADETRQETAVAHQNRLLMNIKRLDTHISIQKRHGASKRYGLDYAPLAKQVSTRNVTQEMERLNRLKTVAVYDFITTSLQIESENPHLQPLFDFREEGSGGTHIAMTMWSPADKNILQRLLQPTVPTRVEDGRISYSTNISLVQLHEAYQQVVQNPSSSLEHEIAGHHTMDLLRQRNIRERRRDTTENRDAVQRPAPREVTPDLTDFLQLPVNEQLGKALDDITSAGRDKVVRDKANLERNTAMRNAIEMSPDERVRADVDVVVVAPLDKSGTLQIVDPECTEYSVYVVFKNKGTKKFINTHRGALAGVSGSYQEVQVDDMVALDAIVQQEPNLFGETPMDTYIRRLHEMKLMGMEMSRLSKERKGSPGADATVLLGLTQRMEELGEKRTILAQSAWELADIIQSEYPNMNLVSASAQTQQAITVININYKEIVQQNILGWLMNPRNKTRFSESRRSNDVWFQEARLRKMKDAFDSDETEANGAAIILAERLQEYGIEI